MRARYTQPNARYVDLRLSIPQAKHLAKILHCRDQVANAVFRTYTTESVFHRTSFSVVRSHASAPSRGTMMDTLDEMTEALAALALDGSS